MKTSLHILGVVCSFSAQLRPAQSNFVSSNSVSFYQLSHKPDKTAHRLFEKASSEMKRRDYASSLRLFRKAVSIDPCYWAAENNLGYIYLQLDQQESAKEAFRRAVEIDPKNPIGYSNVSVAALTRNEFPVAEKFARTALRLDPQLSAAQALLALAQVGQGKWSPEARKMLEEGHETVPGSERVLQRWPRITQPGLELLSLACPSADCTRPRGPSSIASRLLSFPPSIWKRRMVRMVCQPLCPAAPGFRWMSFSD